MPDKNDKQYGVINEVGDLGLGFYEVDEKQNDIINESKKHNKEDK